MTPKHTRDIRQHARMVVDRKPQIESPLGG